MIVLLAAAVFQYGVSLGYELALGKPRGASIAGGQAHTYTVQLRAGESATVLVEQRGIDLVLSAIGPGGATLGEIDSPNGAHGPERLTIVAVRRGEHAFLIRSLAADAAAGAYTVALEERLSAAATRARESARRKDEACVVRWLAGRTMPLADAKTAALDAFAGARVVGIGEATHGTREFASLRRMLVEALVTRHGFTLVAFEGSVTATAALDDYVQGGPGDAAAILVQQQFWIPNTAETAEMFRFLRAHNARVEPARRVRIVGIDPQANAGGIAHLRDYLKKVVDAPDADAALAALAEADRTAAVFGRTSVTRAMIVVLERVLAFLASREGRLRYERAADYDRARETVGLLIEFAEFNAEDGAPSASRDAVMADRVLRALRRGAPDTRAIVLAHNAHVARRPGRFETMGAHLSRALGDDYRALALTFDSGSFQAQAGGSNDVRTFAIDAAPRGALEWYLAQAAGDTFLAAFDDAAKPACVTAWLAQPRRMRWVGGVFPPSGASADALREHTVGSEFDGVAFIRRGTAAVPTPEWSAGTGR